LPVIRFPGFLSWKQKFRCKVAAALLDWIPIALPVSGGFFKGFFVAAIILFSTTTR
jgi:hypothetical protein